MCFKSLFYRVSKRKTRSAFGGSTRSIGMGPILFSLALLTPRGRCDTFSAAIKFAFMVH
jgi:hypothetical protein